MRSTSRKKQGGWWQIAAAALGSYLANEGQEDTNEANAGINSAQMAFNADQAEKTRTYNTAEADKNREWLEEQRRTQYQTAIGDMQNAGINPMLAYRQGGAGTQSSNPASSSNATSGSMIPMGNTAKAGYEGALATAQIANVNSATKVNEAEAAKKLAEIPKVEQETQNMKAELYNIRERMGEIVAHKDLLIKQGYTQTDIGNLYNAQTEVAKIEQALKAQNINNAEAEEKLTRVLTTLRKLDVPAASNTARFETKMGSEVGVGTSTLNQIMQILRGITK